ncbi:MAG: hypothetical protein A2W61_03425 [Deltaproteobacteria bacterium RIFCSPLOWO2_01_44_7]|nr:MAG: hypothetical protein A2712_03650 [Deltaproteobacteria bacterium RIFCSPHIGHO2_01_FULL_43_49]OGQ16285.1 MAG: hypothetical protein A3D22_01620 [Deltaproteobacteria bacterium RIFCSPHIGHO2_02_FULL_44_53]OGQ29245.1 MAG: hypothetical protein A3D98_05405 [Deltaproteobacteria bacterium RIFCSPHIGHO2_12_FULL_44_21]OGQ32802.1 MAG: hypothetical protein A2979_09550 [Deltaproteobacteria bacterium RIFCSPLOWO2_01_FULL_45_74]OGQ41452.1 MAG: hypothetical protein A2W61_03425 [Deltaproteobacteria bacterium 
MKKVFILLFLGLALQPIAQARMSGDTFNSGEKVTAGKLFLNQVDMVSLYLSTERVVYVPRLTSDTHLSVELTILGMGSNASEALKNFVMRHINTFNKTLRERLEYYTPTLANEFDPTQDVQFSIHVGTDKRKVATWSGGQWAWVERVQKQRVAEASPVTQATSPQPFTEIQPKEVQKEKKTCEKSCPAMIGEEETQAD